MSFDLIQIIIQGGSVGVSVLLIILVAKAFTAQSKSSAEKDVTLMKFMSNHDQHLIDALDKNSIAWMENAKALNNLANKINNKWENDH